MLLNLGGVVNAELMGARLDLMRDGSLQFSHQSRCSLSLHPLPVVPHKLFEYVESRRERRAARCASRPRVLASPGKRRSPPAWESYGARLSLSVVPASPRWSVPRTPRGRSPRESERPSPERT